MAVIFLRRAGVRVKCRNVTYLGLIHVDIWQKQTLDCKTIILQLKTNKFKKIKQKKERKRVRRKAHSQETENSLQVFYTLINNIFLYSPLPVDRRSFSFSV